jgi:hypothetical protein
LRRLTRDLPNDFANNKKATNVEPPPMHAAFTLDAGPQFAPYERAFQGRLPSASMTTSPHLTSLFLVWTLLFLSFVVEF